MRWVRSRSHPSPHAPERPRATHRVAAVACRGAGLPPPHSPHEPYLLDDPRLGLPRPTSSTPGAAHNFHPPHNRRIPATVAFERTFAIKHLSYPARYTAGSLCLVSLTSGMWGELALT
jgi:hypothetical protein